MALRGKWKTDQYCKHGTCWSEFKTSANAEFKLLSDIMEMQKKLKAAANCFITSNCWIWRQRCVQLVNLIMMIASLEWMFSLDTGGFFFYYIKKRKLCAFIPYVLLAVVEIKIDEIII